MTDPIAPLENCVHCPDGHKRPDRQSWSAWVTDDRDGDGQPTTIHVARSNGAHVAESDAEWIRERLNPRGQVDRELEDRRIDRVLAMLLLRHGGRVEFTAAEMTAAPAHGEFVCYEELTTKAMVLAFQVREEAL